MKVSRISTYTPDFSRQIQRNFVTTKPQLKEKVSDKDTSLEILGSYNLSFLGRDSVAAYVIDENGEYERFNAISKATRSINSANYGKFQLLGEGPKVVNGKYAIMLAQDVEIENENGEIVVDEEKIRIAKEAIETKRKDAAVYSIDKDGNYTKYENPQTAAEDTGAKLNDVRNIIRGCSKTTKGLAYVRAEEVETTDENGNIVVDENKIKELVKIKFTKKKTKCPSNPIYSMDKEGNYRRFESTSEVAKAYNMPPSTVANNLYYGTTSSGYRFIKASDVEIRDKKGNYVLDEDKIKDIYKNTRFSKPRKKRAASSIQPKKPKPKKDDAEKDASKKYQNVKIYAMRPGGEYETFRGIDEVSEKLGISKDDILSGMRRSEWVQGYCFSSDFDK